MFVPFLITVSLAGNTNGVYKMTVTVSLASSVDI